MAGYTIYNAQTFNLQKSRSKRIIQQQFQSTFKQGQLILRCTQIMRHYIILDFFLMCKTDKFQRRVGKLQQENLCNKISVEAANMG